MFVVLDLPLLALDGFHQHFQVTAHTSKQRHQKISATSNLSERKPRKNIGNAVNQTQGRWDQKILLCPPGPALN